RGRKRSCQKQSFERNVDDTGSLGVQTSDRRQHQRRGQTNRRKQKRECKNLPHYIFAFLKSPNCFNGPRNIASAATNTITIPSSISTMSFETCIVNASTKIPPRKRIANKIAARKTPTGWLRPSNATAIPTNP